MAVKSSGYSGEVTCRIAQILPGWGVEKAKRMGASMIRLLVYHHPDSSTADQTEDFTAQVAADCLKFDLGLMLELLSYSLSDEKLTSDEKRYVVVETAHRLTLIAGVDILKAEFPLDLAEDDPDRLAAACAEVSAVSVNLFEGYTYHRAALA